MLGVLAQPGEADRVGIVPRANQIVAARKRTAAGGIAQLTHHGAQPPAQAVPYHCGTGAAGHGERHTRRAVPSVEEIAKFEYTMAADSTIPAEPLNCRR